MEVSLLGSHRNGRGDQRQIPSALLESIREIVERWPQPPDPILGRSFSSLLRRSSVCPRTPTSNRNLLRNLLLKIAGSNALKRGSVSWQAPTLLSSPLPTLDRRSLVLRSLGNTPMFYPHEIDWRRRIEQDRVHVYLDVSGSIGDLKPVLYGAVLDAGEYVYPAIHLFSTQVFDVSLSQLRRGDCQTTDGTDITCVAGHVRKHKVRRAVIITDGYTGRPTGAAEEALGRTLLGVALTPNGHTRSDLSSVANHWIELGRKTK